MLMLPFEPLIFLAHDDRRFAATDYAARHAFALPLLLLMPLPMPFRLSLFRCYYSVYLP